MNRRDGYRTRSGVWIAADYRDNLIVDRYNSQFNMMRANKLRHLRSENSEDVVTWNVFQSLRQVNPAAWLPDLFTHAFPDRNVPATDHVTISLWRDFPPPPSPRSNIEEGRSEIDVVIETPLWVWFIEAKLHSDIAQSTTRCVGRDQVLRNIDVGTYYAGARDFFFSLLVPDHPRPMVGVAAIEAYSDLSRPRELLRLHRADGLANLRGVALLTWHHVALVLKHAGSDAPRTDERVYAAGAVEWLSERGLA